MATESSRIIFRATTAPSAKSILVSIPMYMYRIQTNKFEYGLDFFQKAVLMLKSNPEISNTDIASCLGLQVELVELVVQELRYNGFLDDNGNLTLKGSEKKQDIDGLVVNPEQKQIGYVFQFVNQNDYYRFYEKELGDEPNLTSNDGIIIGTKGDGQDNYRQPYKLNFIADQQRTLPAPNENILLDLISKSSKKEDIFEGHTFNQIRKSLSLRFFNNQSIPSLVNVCTYVYLPKREEDDLYEPQWQVLDPFGHGDSGQLKFYLESFKNPDFKKELEKKFSDARTVASKNFNDYSLFIAQETENMRESDFEVGYRKLDKNLQTYLDSAIKNMFIFRQCEYNDFDSSDMFIISTQKALETLFLIDAEKRPDIYAEMKDEFSTPEKGNKEEYVRVRQGFIKDLVRSRLINMSEPGRLIGLAKRVEPNLANSLKQYVYNLVLTYNYDNNSPLFKLIDGNIESLFNIAELRNKKGHGQTENEGSVVMISKEVAEDTYNFLKMFINKYINIAL